MSAKDKFKDKKNFEDYFEITSGKDMFNKKKMKNQGLEAVLVAYPKPERELFGLGKYCFVMSKKDTDMFFLISLNARYQLVVIHTYNYKFEKENLLKIFPKGFDYSRNFFEKEVVTMHSSKKERKKWGKLIVSALKPFYKSLIGIIE